MLSHFRVVLVGVLALSFGLGGWVLAGHAAQSYTGCLSSRTGAIYDMRQGDTPMSPCKEGDVVIHVSGGDITSVSAGPGLSGGAVTGDVTLSVNFAGSGSANTVAHSDHNHDSTYAAIEHVHDDRYFTETELQTSGLAGVHWDNLTDVPTGFADGVDDDTTYSAGTGLALSGTEFSVTSSYRLPQSCGSGQIPEWSASLGVWACGVDDIGGAGAGWSLTGNSGTTPANFLGTTDDRALEIRVNNNRALRVEPTGVNSPGPFPGPSTPRTPNIVGGSTVNSTATGIEGATIGGGGQGITDPAIPASRPNQVNGSFGTVGGGYGNTAGAGATVDGGNSNVAGGLASTVGGGSDNTAGGQHAVIGGGGNNNTLNTFATVAGGASNAASGFASTVGGGWTNTANAPFATVAGGFRASASHYGEQAHASGMFTSAGDAQSSAYVLRGVSAGGTPSELFLDGTSQRITIAGGRTVAFDILLVARSGDGSAAYSIRGLIENLAGTTTLVGLPVVTILGEDDPSWDAAAFASDTSDSLTVVVASSSAVARWVASVRTAEVGQ